MEFHAQLIRLRNNIQELEQKGKWNAPIISFYDFQRAISDPRSTYTKVDKLDYRMMTPTPGFFNAYDFIEKDKTLVKAIVKLESIKRGFKVSYISSVSPS